MVMIMMMPLMLMMLLLMICADGSLPTLRWLAGSKSASHREANVDRESYGYRREEGVGWDTESIGSSSSSKELGLGGLTAYSAPFVWGSARCFLF